MLTGFRILGVSAVVLVAVLLVFLQTRRDATIGFILRQGVPLMMGIAYVTLALTSGMDASGVAWLSIGFSFVLVVWWVMRYLMTNAALARALAVGEVDRILELADVQIRQRRGRSRVPYEAARAVALEIGGDFAGSLAAIEALDFGELGRKPALARQVAATRIAALVELRRAADARAILDATWPDPAEMLPPTRMVERALATGRVHYADGDHAAATRELDKVIAMILATPLQRATAHAYLARIARASAEPAVATKHDAEVARFAPPVSWLAQNARDIAKPT